MSVQINCDRCGRNTRGFFYNAQFEVRSGAFASITSKAGPAERGVPWKLDWHICQSCFAAARTWSKPPEQVSP